MSALRVLAKAPSNIAIVKYMGKADSVRNLPANSSLSMTLSRLCTFVELRESRESETRFFGEVPEGATGEAPRLRSEGTTKFLKHFERVRSRAPELLRDVGLEFREAKACEIRSSNTFPSAAGIASSASSFAALTLAASAYFTSDSDSFRATYTENKIFRRNLAALSREGSGSSCRSFEGPFVTWEGEVGTATESRLPALSDLVVVVSAGEKPVGSSEAHHRVLTSPYWSERPIRATNRFQDLKTALAGGDFSSFAEIANADFRDMHRLFETSVPPFSFFASGTSEVLDFLAGEKGIAVSMDAGPNIHVIVPQKHEEFWRRKLTERFPQFPVLVDREGSGAEILFLGSDR